MSWEVVDRGSLKAAFSIATTGGRIKTALGAGSGLTKVKSGGRGLGTARGAKTVSGRRGGR